ncbi:GAF and ANTAR domain-containing protein [Rhodococcus sp. NBC_00297]|uniref:GAF and ANTAR domain-containing protein n=1 Tax=Rhodococcus sp. NBC_00297 TaxID=2976005 RepID=UPI002E2B0C8F|nr:GAF and ANTAR domain-containing protein [Rhodococcus sp. NBC_00297]
MLDDPDTHTDTGDASRSLGHAMAEMARVIQEDHDSVDETLSAITAQAVHLIPGADHAGITLVTKNHKVDSRAATDDLPRIIDELQERCQEGPCLDTVWKHHSVRVVDMASEDRWPTFSPAAADQGVQSMLTFRLYTHRDHLGALNLYSDTAHGFDDTDDDVGIMLATHAAIALVAAEREEKLESALATRDVIGQAKGIVMERYDLRADAAFAMLVRLSQEWHTPVTDLAERIARRDQD